MTHNPLEDLTTAISVHLEFCGEWHATPSGVALGDQDVTKLAPRCFVNVRPDQRVTVRVAYRRANVYDVSMTVDELQALVRSLTDSDKWLPFIRKHMHAPHGAHTRIHWYHWAVAMLGGGIGLALSLGGSVLAVIA